MDVADKLKLEGWSLSSSGLEQVTNNGAIKDVKSIIRRALDFDLKEISNSAFIEDVVKAKAETIEDYAVLQVQKVRNISAPKVNEESKAAPRMLKILITDGSSTCHAIEVEHTSSLSLSTPPGTKFRFKPGEVSIIHGMIQLKPTMIEFLGGNVAHLVEKWELNRSLAKHNRGRIGEEGGPPPWIPFGHKITRLQQTDRNFKSLDPGNKENKENAEFEAQRKDAIAEAARCAGSKKVFGGGTKQMLDHNVQQIVDLGFTVTQAEYALKQSRNNVGKAIKSLQRRDEGASPKVIGKPEGKGRKKNEKEEEKGVAAKPSGKVSLFDFLEDKLPVDKEVEKKIDKRPGERKNFDYKDDRRNLNKFNDTNTWHPDRQTRPSQGQKPPRFQQNAQRYQQKQTYGGGGGGGRNNYDSHTWSNDQWGNFSGLPSNNYSYRQTSDEQFGQWKPNKWKNNDDDYRRSGIATGESSSSSSRQTYDHQSYASYSNNKPHSSNFIPDKVWQWQEGDKCMAKYWEDNRHYRAEVTGVSDRTVVVRFVEYGNFEEVLHQDCIPITEYD